MSVFRWGVKLPATNSGTSSHLLPSVCASCPTGLKPFCFPSVFPYSFYEAQKPVSSSESQRSALIHLNQLTLPFFPKLFSYQSATFTSFGYFQRSTCFLKKPETSCYCFPWCSCSQRPIFTVQYFAWTRHFIVWSSPFWDGCNSSCSAVQDGKSVPLDEEFAELLRQVLVSNRFCVGCRKVAFQGFFSAELLL